MTRFVPRLRFCLLLAALAVCGCAAAPSHADDSHRRVYGGISGSLLGH